MIDNILCVTIQLSSVITQNKCSITKSIYTTWWTAVFARFNQFM